MPSVSLSRKELALVETGTLNVPEAHPPGGRKKQGLSVLLALSRKLLQNSSDS